jgi:acyl dehydratase
VGEITVAGELVWDGVSTYLATGATAPETPAAAPAEPRPAWEPQPPIATWRLPAGLGRDYRRVSGDPNPIHTSALAARAFGFARPIIHGMWSHARLLAALDARLPAAYRVDVDFARPLPLPSTVGAGWRRDGEGWLAAVTTADGGRPYLVAQIQPLDGSAQDAGTP